MKSDARNTSYTHPINCTKNRILLPCGLLRFQLELGSDCRQVDLKTKTKMSFAQWNTELLKWASNSDMSLPNSDIQWDHRSWPIFSRSKLLNLVMEEFESVSNIRDGKTVSTRICAFIFAIRHSHLQIFSWQLVWRNFFPQ